MWGKYILKWKKRIKYTNYLYAILKLENILLIKCGVVIMHIDYWHMMWKQWDFSICFAILFFCFDHINCNCIQYTYTSTAMKGLKAFKWYLVNIQAIPENMWRMSMFTTINDRKFHWNENNKISKCLFAYIFCIQWSNRF